MPVPIAVIGCGIAARKLHLPALEANARRFRVAMVCNRSADKARSFAELAGGVPWVTDYREVLASPDVDAVLVVLPVDLNLEVGRAALRAGKHLLLEKPLACSMKEGRALIRAAAATDRVAMLAENYRYKPALRRVRALIDAGRLGEVYAVQWSVLGEVSPANSPYARTAWRIDHRYPGGFVMDAGVHYAHAIRHLFGDVTRVRGWSRSVNPAIGAVDTHNLEFDTERGIHGTLANYFSVSGFVNNRLVVMGTRATAVLEGGTALTLHARGKAPAAIKVSPSGGYVEQLTAFHASITRGAPIEATFEEGLKDFALIEASLRSAEQGRALTLGGL